MYLVNLVNYIIIKLGRSKIANMKLRNIILYKNNQTFLISDGMDFFFGFEPYARKLTDFLQTMVPMRFNTSKKLISHDGKSNTYNYKYVFR